jgi:hypothetical protein
LKNKGTTAGHHHEGRSIKEESELIEPEIRVTLEQRARLLEGLRQPAEQRRYDFVVLVRGLVAQPDTPEVKHAHQANHPGNGVEQGIVARVAIEVNLARKRQCEVKAIEQRSGNQRARHGRDFRRGAVPDKGAAARARGAVRAPDVIQRRRNARANDGLKRH